MCINIKKEKQLAPVICYHSPNIILKVGITKFRPAQCMPGTYCIPLECVFLSVSQNVSNLVDATPPIVLTNLFKTLQVFLSRSEDVYNVWL